MLVVADTSPLSYLAELDLLPVLPGLFQTVFIPPEVLAELSHARAPLAARGLAVMTLEWLHVKSPATVIPLPRLNRAEEAAINLARELAADYLLIDEKDGRRAAQEWNLRITGTLGILEQASERRLVDLQSAFDQLGRTSFRFDRVLAEQILERHRQNALRRVDRPGQS